MNENLVNVQDLDRPAIPWQTLLLLLAGISLGTWFAAGAIPSWLPNLSASLFGANPTAFWYLSRGSALSAYLLLWLSMVLGLGITNKMARLWPGAPTAFELHQYASLLGLSFGFFHALILLGDQYIRYNLAQIALPFASQNYKPFEVGLGQLALYMSVMVTASFYIRREIGQRTWRLIHFASFAIYLLVLIHGISGGTDTSSFWATWMYWATGGSLLFLLFYRILSRHKKDQI
jgi:predicted ferric reductase